MKLTWIRWRRTNTKMAQWHIAHGESTACGISTVNNRLEFSQTSPEPTQTCGQCLLSSLNTERTNKRCPACGITKPLSAFPKLKSGKLAPYCQACQKLKDKERRTPEANLARQLKRFGLTVDLFEALIAEQKGVCAICQRPCNSGKRLAVDHCHSTGHIRGLLCLRCNLTIGGMQDDPVLLRAAADYLERAQADG